MDAFLIPGALLIIGVSLMINFQPSRQIVCGNLTGNINMGDVRGNVTQICNQPYGNVTRITSPDSTLNYIGTWAGALTSIVGLGMTVWQLFH